MDSRFLASMLALSLAACSPSGIPEAARALAVEPGPRGTQWHLTGVRAEDETLLVTFRIRGPSGLRVSSWLAADEVHLIDDATSMRYGLLNGADGQRLASDADGNRLEISVNADRESPVWMKFPLPPPSSRTVSIALPRVGTFDGIPIER